MFETQYNQQILRRVQSWYKEPSDEVVLSGKGKTIDAYCLILSRTVLTFTATIPDCTLVDWTKQTSKELHRAIYHTQSSIVTARLWAQISLDENEDDIEPEIRDALNQDIDTLSMGAIIDKDFPLFLPPFEKCVDLDAIANGNISVIEDWFDRVSFCFCRICPNTLGLKESLFFLAIAYLSTNKLIQLSRKESGNLSRIQHLKLVTQQLK